MRGTQNNYVALKGVRAGLLFPGHDVHWDEPIDVGGRAYADTVECNYRARHAWRQTDTLFVWAAGETEAWWFPPCFHCAERGGKKQSRKRFWILKYIYINKTLVSFSSSNSLSLVGENQSCLNAWQKTKTLFGIRRAHSTKAGSQTLHCNVGSSINRAYSRLVTTRNCH